ncbi:MAG: HAMP domain-containing histidine kinase [Acidobacteriota bacterium]|nr:HAMP domain-containing histidine kinase [Acidobacteriota bacterium]
MSASPEPKPAHRGVGPSLLGQLTRDRGLRFAMALAVAVAVPVAILFYFRFQSLSNLQRASTVVLQQLSESAADDLTKNVEQELKRPHLEVLLRSQYQTEPLNLPYVRTVFTDGLRKIPFVDAFYVWSTVAGAHSGQVMAVEREPDPAHPGQTRAVMRESVPEGPFILAKMRELAAHHRIIVLSQVDLDGRPTWLEFQLRFSGNDRGALSSFVGLRVDAERLRRDYFPALMRQEIKGLEVPEGFPPLVVTLLDQQNHVIFNSSDRVPNQFVVQRSFPLVFFDKEILQAVRAYEPAVTTWHIGIGYGHRSIGAITKAQTATQVGLMAALAVVLALGVFFVARAAAREVRLAELKSNFVSSVSHDLKTPLALIQMFAETLELGRLRRAERAQEYYRIINSEARKLTRLINNILDFSKTEAGLRQYKMRPVDLGDLARHVLASFESQFQQNHFHVTSDLQPAQPVWADAEAIEQAFENLLSNAMKYSPERREIEVSVGQAGPEAFLRVRDHGVGIPPRFRRKIFRKFYRVEPDDGHGPQGCGLGLAIVDHVMRAHSGSVDVESQEGQGSTFTLRVPLCDPALVAEPHPDKPMEQTLGNVTTSARA